MASVEDTSAASASKPAVLTYFAGRGRAEAIRWMLAAAKVPFVHAPPLATREPMLALLESGKLRFNQVGGCVGATRTIG